MPCEACNIQFTVFKRKKSCTECRRLYCSNCLTKNKERILCTRCVIFTTRPLSKIELLKLKAKDLIFYLQSKHISTTGCVEKEELVNLVLIHVDNSNNFTPDSHQSPTSFSMGTDQSDDARSNPFDQIRNTCQNLFSTFTEKISADFNFDFKQNQSDRQTNVCEDQPRYSNSFQNVNSINSNSSMSNNGSSTTSNNGNMKPKRPTTMQTSSEIQSSRRQSANVLSNSNNSSTIPGTDQQCLRSNSQSSPTITGNSSSSSTPSMLKSMSSEHSLSRITTTSIPATVATARNGPKSSLPTSMISAASTSTKDKPAYAKLTKLTQIDCHNDGSCECSDDELITKFRQSYADHSLSPTALTVTENELQTTDSNTNKSSNTDHLTTASSSSSSSSSCSAKQTEQNSEIALKQETLESSDISSFEDLGAVGGSIGQIRNAFCAPKDTDKWQIVNPAWNNIDETASTSSIITDDKNEIINNSSNGGEGSGTSYTTNLPNSITELTQVNNDECKNQKQLPSQLDEITEITFRNNIPAQHSATSTQQMTTDLRTKVEKTLKSRHTHRKITRRQSDGIVYTASTSNSNNRTGRFLDDVDDYDEDVSSTSESSHKRTHKSCRKCGKTKGDLKKYIARFRHQLETTTTCSETEIRQQLDAFLEFLENHSAIFDSMTNTELVQSPSQFVADAIELDEFDDDDYDDEAGIHVYGSNDDTNTTTHSPRQFFNLNTVEKKEELDDLSVKQLKEVLMLNRVDFKGCCEKSELLERVQRLWHDLENCPAVDKLPTVDLCKICMDAAIECVLLECGHMATCTNCGKVLSECPICRQYIVRVVRFFKA